MSVKLFSIYNLKERYYQESIGNLMIYQNLIFSEKFMFLTRQQIQMLHMCYVLNYVQRFYLLCPKETGFILTSAYNTRNICTNTIIKKSSCLLTTIYTTVYIKLHIQSVQYYSTLLFVHLLLPYSLLSSRTVRISMDTALQFSSTLELYYSLHTRPIVSGFKLCYLPSAYSETSFKCSLQNRN